MAHYTELKKSMEKNKGLASGLPNEMKSFMSLHNAALEDGALDPKTKELIALGMSISIRCEPCIVAHASALIDLSVSRKEIEETAAVSLFMGGGPATAYGGQALECYDELIENN